jgi:nucleotide-binding universal stress UspA family protein
MSGPPMAGPIERVVVPLDAASESRTAIETAARLAAHAKAPLHGVFVEDEDLLHVASLPFARQFTLGAHPEKLTTEHLELHLRVAAERARKEFFAAAKRHGVTGSFEIVRGASESALTGASEHDLVVACALTRPIAGHFRLECRWWSSLEAMPGPFLLARHVWSASGSVVMLLRDRSDASARLLEAAAQIAHNADSRSAAGGGADRRGRDRRGRDRRGTDRRGAANLLTVICLPAIAGKGFEKWIADRLAGHPVRLQIEIAPAEPAALHQRIGELDCRLLAIEAGSTEGRGDRLREFVERCGCDILMVR